MPSKPYLNTDTQVLLRVPEYQECDPSVKGVHIAIIDLETTGLNFITDSIIEIGIIKINVDAAGDCEVIDTYNQLQDPGVEISRDIVKITGISTNMVQNKHINWAHVEHMLTHVDAIVCHNAGFDRKFLEQTTLGELFKNKIFLCSKSDVDWSSRGYGATKLDYLNWKMGYFYDGHRAINDCWATLNILTQEEGALQELLSHSKTKYRVLADNAPFAVKDILKNNGFVWDPEMRVWGKEAAEPGEVCEFINEFKLGSPVVIEIPANRRYSTIGITPRTKS